MSDFNAVIEVKKRSHRSWKNFRQAAYYELGLDSEFGTPKVSSNSRSYLNTASTESGLSIREILTERDKRNLGN